MTALRNTRFCLVRHGETDWNSEKRVQGQIDIDLNSTGQAQARAVAEGLREHRFAAVYSSDLLRAWRTAQIAAARWQVAVSPAPTLRERDFGVLQGLTAAEARQARPHAYRHHQARTPDYDCETGESLVAFAARDFALPNAAFNWLEYGDTGWRLIAWADCTHLQRALDEALE
jgi:probable phosphoglycerate mutase